MAKKSAPGRTRAGRPAYTTTAAHSRHVIDQLVYGWIARIIGKLHDIKESLPMANLLDQLGKIEASLDETIAEGKDRPVTEEEQLALNRVAEKAQQAADLVKQQVMDPNEQIDPNRDPNAPQQ